MGRTRTRSGHREKLQVQDDEPRKRERRRRRGDQHEEDREHRRTHRRTRPNDPAPKRVPHASRRYGDEEDPVMQAVERQDKAPSGSLATPRREGHKAEKEHKRSVLLGMFIVALLSGILFTCYYFIDTQTDVFGGRGGGDRNYCFPQGTDLDGEIMSDGTCGVLCEAGKKCRCETGRCCSVYGYCGPSDGCYNRYECSDTDTASFCDPNSGDWRPIPCTSSNKRGGWWKGLWAGV